MPKNPKNPQTQTTLDKVKLSRQTAEERITEALKASIPLVALAAQTASEIRADAQLVELMEDDLMLRPKFNLYNKTAARIQEHCREAEAAQAKILQAIRQLALQDAEIREIATEKGYTV